MSFCPVRVQFDTSFKVPPDSLREGRVECKVVRADCKVLDVWHGKVLFRIKLLLRITIKSGQLVDTFHRKVEFDDFAWLEKGCWILDCEVVAAACRCVVKRGLVLCSGCLAVRFFFRHKHVCCPESICFAEPDCCPEPICSCSSSRKSLPPPTKVVRCRSFCL